MKLSWSKILKNKQRESHVTPTRQVDGVICAFTFCIFIEVIFGETGRGYSADTTDYSPWSEDLQEWKSELSGREIDVVTIKAFKAKLETIPFEIGHGIEYYL